MLLVSCLTGYEFVHTPARARRTRKHTHTHTHTHTHIHTHALQVRPLVDEIVRAALKVGASVCVWVCVYVCVCAFLCFAYFLSFCHIFMQTIHPFVVSEAATADARARWMQVTADV